MTGASMSRALSKHAIKNPSRSASKATAMRLIRCPAFAASSRHRCSNFSNALSSTASFFNGWRSTPGTMPATSQLNRLSSITAISVPSGSRGLGDRLRSFNFCMGRSIGSHQQRWMQYPRRRPIASPLEVCGRRPRCARHHLHEAGIRKPSQYRKSKSFDRPMRQPSDWVVWCYNFDAIAAFPGPERTQMAKRGQAVRRSPTRSKVPTKPKGAPAEVDLKKEIATLRRELAESLEQQTATSEVLQVISSTPGELEPVFQKMLENATRVCGAKFGTMALVEGDVIRRVASFNVPFTHTDAPETQAFRPHPKNGIGQVISTNQVAYIPDLRTSPAYLERDPAVVSFVEAAGVRLLTIVPLPQD